MASQTVTVTPPSQTVTVTTTAARLQPVIIPNVAVTRSISIDTKIDELGSLRGRVGFAYGQNWLLYGTGGAGWAHATNTTNATETFSLGDGIVLNTVRASGGTTLLGYAVGGGLDYKMPIDQGSSLVFGFQYLHYGFPKNTMSLADGNGGTAR